VKLKLAEASGIPIEELCVKFAGRPFESGKKLKDYHIEDACTITVERGDPA